MSQLIAPSGCFVDGDWVETKDQDPTGVIRLTQLADIGDGTWRNRSSRFMTLEKAQQLHCTFLETGDVLVARMPDPLGRSCIFPGDTQRCVTVVDVCVIRPGDNGVSTRWLSHFINTPQFRASIYRLQSGSTRKRISRTNLATLPLRVPPSTEQRRIADAIESYFSRLNDPIAALERVQRNLKRYRASVLNAAAEGRLVSTEAELARAEGRNYEPASALLDRILAERRHRWQGAALVKMKAKGKSPMDDKWKAKYSGPVAPKTSHLPELPEGWCWASCAQLIHKIQTGPFGTSLRQTDYVVGGTPIINPQHLRNYRIHPSERARAGPNTMDRLSAFVLRAGDIVLGRRGEMGRCAVVGDREDGWLLGTGSLALRPVEGVDAHFLAWVLRSPRSVRILEGEAVGTTMTNLNQKILLDLAIPLAPATEQVRIVHEIERQFSMIGMLDHTGDRQRLRCARLRQSILKWAFDGRLVDQDPTDEHAARLLERIRAEREVGADKSPRNPRRAKVASAKS